MRNALREDNAEHLDTVLKDFIHFTYEAIGIERAMDGDGVQALIERSLALVNEVHARLGRPELCVVCPELHRMEMITPDADEGPDPMTVRQGFPKSPSLGFMELRCGHRVHTQCYVNRLAQNDITSLRTRCGICDTTILEQSAIDYFRGTMHNARDVSVVKLWETNPTFRTELNELRKKRSKCVAFSKEVYSELKVYKEEFTRLTSISVETLRMYKKDFMKKMNAVKNRRAMVYQISSYSRKLREFCKRHKIWAGSLRQLRTVNGGPRIPVSMQIPWKFRSPVRRMLRLKRI